jgi:hypothetical protein
MSSTLPGSLGRISPKSLITDESWDCFHLESLLALKELYPLNNEFGFILRHYWLPASILTFRQSSRIVFPGESVVRHEAEIERRMARCRSNECLWREKACSVAMMSGNGEHTTLSESLCVYDCFEQTYRQVPIKSYISNEPLAPVDALAARRRALYELPILVPPGPNPVGFAWYAKVGDDFMNYRLEAEEHIKEISVLVIRREGRYTLWTCEKTSDGEKKTSSIVIERNGISIFATNRCVVLEDHFLDRVVQASDNLVSIVGMVNQVVTRLIRSCPESQVQKDQSLVNDLSQHISHSSQTGGE